MNSIQRIEAELFSQTQVIQYQPGLESQSVKDGIIYVGSRSGPKKLQADALCHELAHFVEIDDERMTCCAWGLHYPKVEVLGHICVEPSTMAMTDRELRVCAYQAHIHEYFEVDDPIESTVSSLKYMPDTLFVPMECGRRPYSKDAPDISIKEREDSQHRWRMARVHEYMKEFTLERFFSEWKRRVALLEASPH